jgi:hypothetical protein
LLDDAETTKVFAQKLLLSPQVTTLKELYLFDCSQLAVGYNIIINSMEKNETLRVLNVIEQRRGTFQLILREQLILSLPKMKGVERLHVTRGLLDLNDQRIMTAFGVLRERYHQTRAHHSF